MVNSFPSSSDKEKRVQELVETDETYCFIKERVEMYRKILEKIQKFLPHKLKAIIYGYSAYGMMMAEGKLSICLEHMDFPKKKGKKYDNT